MKTLFWIGAWLASVALDGCAVMPNDFAKATKLTDASLGESHSVHRVMALPAGQAELVVAVPNYHCKPAASEEAIRVRIAGEHIGQIDVTMKFGDLTWAYAVDSCDAYGYVYDKSTGLSRKLQVPVAANAVNVDVDVTSKGEVRPAAVWLIYGSRVPTNRIFVQGRP